jgi:hypothetical protein
MSKRSKINLRRRRKKKITNSGCKNLQTRA